MTFSLCTNLTTLTQLSNPHCDIRKSGPPLLSQSENGNAPGTDSLTMSVCAVQNLRSRVLLCCSDRPVVCRCLSPLLLPVWIGFFQFFGFASFPAGGGYLRQAVKLEPWHSQQPSGISLPPLSAGLTGMSYCTPPLTGFSSCCLSSQ